jgi:hypothetical protein
MRKEKEMQRNVSPPTIEAGGPHVVDQLIQLIGGQRSFTRTERKKIREHLVDCLICQSFLGEYLIESVAYDRANSTSEKPARELLSQLEYHMHRRLKGDIPAYVETFMKSGEDVANERYSLLAGHLIDCQDCREEVEGLQSWLQQAIQENLIEPLEADSSSE